MQALSRAQWCLIGEFCPCVRSFRGKVLAWIPLSLGAFWNRGCSSFRLREQGLDCCQVWLVWAHVSPGEVTTVKASESHWQWPWLCRPTGSCPSTPCPYTLPYTARIPWVNAWAPVFRTDLGASQIPSIWVSWAALHTQHVTAHTLDSAKRPHPEPWS